VQIDGGDCDGSRLRKKYELGLWFTAAGLGEGRAEATPRQALYRQAMAVRSAKISAGKRGCCARVLQHSPSVDSLEAALPDGSRRGRRTELGMGPTGSAVIAVAAWSRGRPRLSGKNLHRGHCARGRTHSASADSLTRNSD
jgi:hypothetical protein